ncbi:hypothetical protein [Novosphingobium sp. 9U]|nr:hypothetical protein [Novosphingobium sp. 9U]VWX49265.1 hypothetical protein NOVOSPHI9U_200002 [Novosphingobium sp. 9U]
MAGRLHYAVRKSDMVARLGGDEFGLEDADQAYTLSWLVRKALERR